MKLETALKTPHTAAQLSKLTGLSRGAVLAALRTHAGKIKKVGVKKVKGRNGPAPTLYQLKKGAVMKRRAHTKVAKVIKAVNAELKKQLDAMPSLNDRLNYPKADVTQEQIDASTVGAAAPEFVSGEGLKADLEAALQAANDVPAPVVDPVPTGTQEVAAVNPDDASIEQAANGETQEAGQP